MFVIASQIILCLLIAVLIGAIIGYVLGKSHCQKKESTPKEASTHELHIDNREDRLEEKGIDEEKQSIVPEVQEEEKIEEQPALLTEPRAEGKDNLQLIKGIGKVIEKALNDTGVFHFDQLANLTENQTNWLDKAISYPGRIKREKWIEQAKDLNERLTHDNPKS